MLWRSPAPTRHPPGFIEPCLPTLGHTVPSGPQWAYEIKHDGYRFICRREGNGIRVFSRRGHDWTDRVPRIVDTFARLPASSVTLDGEGVACDTQGVTNFELLRAASRLSAARRRGRWRRAQHVAAATERFSQGGRNSKENGSVVAARACYAWVARVFPIRSGGEVGLKKGSLRSSQPHFFTGAHLSVQGCRSPHSTFPARQRDEVIE